MQIITLSSTNNPEYWLSEIGKSTWVAAPYLVSLVRENKLKELYGERSEVFLLTEGEKLMSFCTYSDMDGITNPEITPWAGFVFTFPEYRGARRIGKLLEHVYSLAKKDGFKTLYISTEEEGLYEKYGFTFWQIMNEDRTGGPTRVYRKEIIDMDYSDVIGKLVSGTIDRPLNSRHPRHPEMIYPINYGYVDGVFAGDGAEQDVYVFGIEKPIRTYTGKVVGVIHRLNDNEDKWIVSLSGAKIPREEILARTEFQEQYFMSELYL